MPKTNEEKLREEWMKEVITSNAKFVSNISAKQATILAIFWLKVLAEQRKEWVEIVRKKINELYKNDDTVYKGKLLDLPILVLPINKEDNR